jgi:hypothetical protein
MRPFLAIPVNAKTAPHAFRNRNEVDLQRGLHLQLLVLGKLFAVVQRQGLPQGRGRGGILFRGGLADGGRPQVGDLAQQQVSRLPLDQCDPPPR